MMDKKHSPLPWKLDKNSITIRDADNWCVADMHEMSVADSKLIIRAVNSHYQLLEACKLTINQCGDEYCLSKMALEALVDALEKANQI